MIACVEQPDRYCVIVFVGKKGLLSIAVSTWCGEEHDFSRIGGVVQLPDRALEGVTFLSMNAMRAGQPHRPLKLCDTCKKLLQA